MTTPTEGAALTAEDIERIRQFALGEAHDDPTFDRLVRQTVTLCDALAACHTWDGIMALVDEHYPADIFPTLPDDPSRDAESRIVSLLRQLAARDAEIADMTEPADEDDDWGSGLTGSYEQIHDPKTGLTTWAFVDRSNALPLPLTRTAETAQRMSDNFRKTGTYFLKRADELQQEADALSSAAPDGGEATDGR